jgi:uncharacterized protein
VTPAIRAAIVAGLAVLALAAPARAGNEDLVKAARRQIGVTIHYDPAYRRLDYPGGDVPSDRGVCTDVIVRALRTARGFDLQRALHEDIQAHFDAYPNRRRWGASKPDSNIDHRRVPNQMTFLRRAGHEVAVTRVAGDYLPGDVVAWDLGRGILHIGIVTDRASAAGTPLVVHNIGSGAREEDILFRYTVIGHYRLPSGGSVTPRP